MCRMTQKQDNRRASRAGTARVGGAPVPRPPSPMGGSRSMIEEGDRVAVRYRFTGTHSRPFADRLISLGVPNATRELWLMMAIRLA